MSKDNDLVISDASFYCTVSVILHVIYVGMYTVVYRCIHMYAHKRVYTLCFLRS